MAARAFHLLSTPAISLAAHYAITRHATNTYLLLVYLMDIYNSLMNSCTLFIVCLVDAQRAYFIIYNAHIL